MLIEPDCCTANASGILDKALCEGDITANNNLSFLLEPYGLIYGPEPTPATDYSLSYVLTDNSGSILQLADMGYHLIRQAIFLILLTVHFQAVCIASTKLFGGLPMVP